MSANAEARQNALDRVLDASSPTAAIGEELFAVADALSGSPSLRRALTDAGTAEEARVNVVGALFTGRVSEQTMRVLTEAVKLAWSTTGSFVAAIERQGVRAILGQAQVEGRLDEVENQLFKVGRVVDGNPDLRAALSDRSTPASARQGLLADVLGDKVIKPVAGLARRAVLARDRTFDLTMNGYLKAAADMRGRAVATVEVARPLADDQAERLRAALAEG